MIIYYTNKFTSSYKKLPKLIKKEAENKVDLFRKNPFNPSLDTHKLTGKLNKFWSFSINRKYRITFEFIKDKAVLFHKAGTHNIYRS